MSEARNTKEKYLKGLAILLAFVLILSSILLLVNYFDKQKGLFPTQQTEDLGNTLQYNNRDYILKDDIETFLVLGLDKFESTITNDAYNNDQQADFIVLYVIDNANSKCSAIHINRDTMAEINILGVAGQKVDTTTKQIALAHTYGNGKEVSCRNMADAVSKLLLGVKIQHYISLTMDAVPTFNDLVGGVEVEVLDDFTGIDDTLVKGQTTTLLGEHALHYVRDRYGLEDSSNSTRMNRQKQYMKALYTKTLDCIKKDDEFIATASLQISDYIVSDRSITQLQKLTKKVSEYKFVEIDSIKGDSVVGEEFMEFYPDKNSIKEVVIDLFYEPKD